MFLALELAQHSLLRQWGRGASTTSHALSTANYNN